MSDSKIRIGITQGDVNGIGYEVIIKTLCDPRMCELCTPIVYGSAKAASFYKKQIEAAENFGFSTVVSAREAAPKRISLVDCVFGDLRVEPGVLSAAAGEASVAALRAAAADLKAGLIDAVVTAPICKENVQGEQFGFTGHTEFFAHEFGGDPLMLMCSDLLKVGLVTIHIPVSEVSASVTKQRIVTKLRELRQSLIQDFSVREPRIAVLSLNPHAGDGGLIGSEEKEIIVPAIQAASQQKILAFGPFAADGFFASAGYMKYDAVLAMYHDQGLPVLKYQGFGRGVNITLGLPFIRTSVDHGTALELAGRGEADVGSFITALNLAIKMIVNTQ